MENISRELLLMKVAEAEKAAGRFVSKELRSKLLMSDTFYSFGGDPILSVNGVDEMSLTEKKIWIACRLWAVCQKIKNTPSLPPEAGHVLATYRFWIANPGISHKAAGASGGRKLPPYSRDLDILINQTIKSWEEKNNEIKYLTKTYWVFRELHGMRVGNIQDIHARTETDGTKVLDVFWESKSGEGVKSLKLGALRKRIKQFVKN